VSHPRPHITLTIIDQKAAVKLLLHSPDMSGSYCYRVLCVCHAINIHEPHRYHAN
jgi:hypothetical protein